MRPVLMTAKFRVNTVTKYDGAETITMSAVVKSEPYNKNGDDENNTFAKFTPNAELSITISNPDLLGKNEPGDELYCDFTRAPKPEPAVDPQAETASAD